MSSNFSQQVASSGDQIIADFNQRWAETQSSINSNRQKILAAVATIKPGSAIDAAAGKLPQPASTQAATGGVSLDTTQQAMTIGEPIPVIFGCRREGAGGVMVQPRATEARFEYDQTTIRAFYHCVLGEGRIGNIEVRDVRRGSCRIIAPLVASFSQNYNRRAGSWAPGVFPAAVVNNPPVFPSETGRGGNYEGISTIEFSSSSQMGRSEWATQWNVFVRRGLVMEAGRLLDGKVDASDNVADLVLWAWLRSNRVRPSMVDMTTMKQAAAFIEANQLWCNGEFKTSGNITDWLMRLLPYFLLRVTKKGGKHSLRPLLPVRADGTIDTGAIFPAFVLDEASILPDSFTQEWSDAANRQPLHMSMMWRQQATDTDTPLVRSFELMPSGFIGANEQHDMSQFCTTENHAAKVGVYIHARRNLSTHTASVKLRPGAQTGNIQEGDIVIVAFNMATQVEPTTIYAAWYSVEDIGHSSSGEEVLSLAHFPVNEQGQSLIALAVAGAQGTGVVLPTPEPTCDLPGTSTDQTVPDASTSGTPFSSQSPDGTGGNGDIVKYPNDQIKAGGGDGSSTGGASQGATHYMAAGGQLIDLFYRLSEGGVGITPSTAGLHLTKTKNGPQFSPPLNISPGQSIDYNTLSQINSKVENGGSYSIIPLGFDPNFWESGEITFEVSAWSWSWKKTGDTPGGGADGGALGAPARLVGPITVGRGGNAIRCSAGGMVVDAGVNSATGRQLKGVTNVWIYYEIDGSPLTLRTIYGGYLTGYVDATCAIYDIVQPKVKIHSWKRLS